MNDPTIHPVDAFIDQVWNERDLELLEQLSASDYVVLNLADGSVPIRDRSALRRHIEEWIESFPDLRMTEVDRVGDAKRVAVVLRVTGTHTGAPFQGIQATGRSIEAAMLTIFDVGRQRLLSHSTLLDTRRLLEQLTPSTPASPPATGRLPLTGGCNCGAVRFEVSAPLLSASYCHCRRCQRRSGAAASANAHPANGTFAIVAGEEHLRVWQPDHGGEKWFCGECGSSVYAYNPSHPESIGIRMGAFDEDPGVRPGARQFVRYAAPWEAVPDDGLPRYPESRHHTG